MVIRWMDMTTKIAEREGKKVQLNIAQVSEVLAITLDLLNEHTDDEILEFIRARKVK